MKPSRLSFVPPRAVLVFLFAFVAACGGDDTSTGGTVTGSTTATGSTSGTTGATSAGAGGARGTGGSGVGGACPPCAAPPDPSCKGEGPCGCGPYVCPDAGNDSGGTGAACGPVTCPVGKVCCNRVMGICTDPGGVCIQ